MIYRRFGYLQSRLLLEKQEELRVLEEELDILDAQMHNKRPNDLTTTNLPKDVAEPRKLLMEKIQNAFCDYCKNTQFSDYTTIQH
jgi:hypothetical protein